jgi:phosphoribosylglycinamide formyltransferase-1
MSSVAILASGTGTILQAILTSDVPVSMVITDRDCRALDVAKDGGVKALCVDRRNFGYAPGSTWDHSSFTTEVANLLEESKISLVAMSGFMTILSSEIFHRFKGPILNTHPSLLPRFRGAYAVPLALAAGVQETGCTVHLATPKIDSGAILAQAKVPILASDTVASLHERIKIAERKLYPRVILDVLSRLDEFRPSR